MIELIGILLSGVLTRTLNPDTSSHATSLRRRNYDRCEWGSWALSPKNMMGVANLKLILLCFENMSGLKVNFYKSELVVVGTTKFEQVRMANLVNCNLVELPISYLGLPVSDKRLSHNQGGS
jgi:hypothetical protein